jgi:hypothetical protein
MRLNPKLQEPSTILQELLNNPPEIHQADLAEYLRLLRVFELSKIDLDTSGSQIAEMLAMGFAVQPGAHTVEFVGGKLKVVAAERERSKLEARLPEQ